MIPSSQFPCDPLGGSTGQTLDLHRLLVESVRDYAIYMLDPHGYIVSWNIGAERIKGYQASEVLQQHYSIFFTPEDIAAGLPQRQLDIVARDRRTESEGWRVRKDGTHFWAQVNLTALHNEAGELVGFAKVTRDLTERQRTTERQLATARQLAAEESARAAAEAHATALAEAAQALERRTAEAEAANRAKVDFLTAMSHELRTPLNAIGGYAELLAMGLRGPLTDEQRQDVERIMRSQQHLLHLIDDILNFSRSETGRLEYHITQVSVRHITEIVSGVVLPQAIEKGVTYEMDNCPAGTDILADECKVKQILINLLSNAIKFTPKGGRVALSCRLGDNDVFFHVRDTGPGVPAGQAKHIFEPFVQIGRSLTQSLEGIGLGLPISRGLARGMGGDVTVESEEGQGSTFTVRLRRYVESPAK